MVLICGLPNAGKTTLSERYADVIHYDDIVVEKRKQPLHALCEMITKASDDVCIEGVFLRARERSIIAQAKDGCRKTCIWLKTPLEECVRRENRNRATCLIKSCSDLFEPPTYSEGWDEIIEINNYEGKYDDHNNSNHQP